MQLSVAEYNKAPRSVKIPGTHLEGPYVCEKQLGAQNPAFRRDPDFEELKKLHAISPVLIITLAPELPGACDFIAKATALGVRVTPIRRATIAALIPACRTADWLIAALPSDTGTDNLVSAAVLRALPRRAVFINVGRGNAVDEEALATALRTHRLAAACLDVFKREPLDSTSPLAADLPNLHRLPHATAFAPDYLPLFFEELAAACP